MKINHHFIHGTDACAECEKLYDQRLTTIESEAIASRVDKIQQMHRDWLAGK